MFHTSTSLTKFQTTDVKFIAVGGPICIGYQMIAEKTKKMWWWEQRGNDGRQVSFLKEYNIK